jgi:hypothetical protein
VKPSQLKNELHKWLHHPEAMKGSKITEFPSLQNSLKGFRTGEVTVVCVKY